MIRRLLPLILTPLLACSGPGSGAEIDARPLGSCEASSGVCDECMDEKCADLITACAADADCACMSECMGDEGVGGVPRCLDSLGLSERPAGFASLEECTAFACPDGDECSTPSDWTPPGDDVACAGSAAGIGGGNLADCSFDPGMTFDPDGTVLQLESAGGAVCARLERRDDGAGTLENTSWTLIELRVGPPGEVALVEDPDGCWYSSHHNFRDWIHAWTGTRHYDLVVKEDGHGGPRRYELYAFEEGPLEAGACPSTADGTACIDGPIELLPVNP